MPPYNIGGGGIAMEGLAMGIFHNAVDIEVFSGFHKTENVSEKVRSYSLEEKVSVHLLPMYPNVAGHKLFDTRLPILKHGIEYLRSHLKKNTYDYAIIMGGYEFCSVQFAGILHSLSIPYFINYQSYYAEGNYSLFFHIAFKTYESLFLKQFHRNAAGHIVISQGLVDYPALYMPNGINREDFLQIPEDSKRDIREFHKISPQQKVIFSIGRLHRLKGFQYAIRAIRDMMDVTYIIAGGDDRYEKELRRFAEGYSNILFIGPLDNQIKKNYFAQADIVLIPSLVEPFGIVGIEAMAHGAAIIANPVGGLNEYLLHDQNALLVDVKNTQELSASISSLLTDDMLRAKIKRNATNDSLQYDWKTIAKELLTNIDNELTHHE
jgi:glycosyltransferase involved in cell wall biosynthesis